MPERYHVIVIGAGPAGTATAMLLAADGLDVLLLDRSHFPRAKPCGDCLSPQVGRLLDRLGLLSAVERLDPAHLTGWRIFGARGACFEGRFDRVAGGDPLVSTAFAVPRARLDAALLHGAVAAGVIVRTGVRVRALQESGGVSGSLADGAPFAARAGLVVGADGLRSVVARHIGAVARRARIRKLSLTAHVTGIDADPDCGEMHVIEGLCAGLAPVSRAKSPVFNLTLVAESDRHGRTVARDPVAFFRTALASFPALRGRFDRLAFTGHGDDDAGRPALLASGPFDLPARRVVAPGVALVGDAAGYFDPFTGQGIHQALAGAELLAEEASAELRGGPARPLLLRYERRLRALVRGPRLIQRMIEAVISRAGLADAAIARLAREPVAGNALLAATGDLAPARSVFAPRVLLALAGVPVPERPPP